MSEVVFVSPGTKPGPLTEPEWRAMRGHPETSEEILRRMMPRELLLTIRHHHERYDGRGYPDGLRGEEIPLVARAICVADSYDAMSFRRPYKRPLSYGRCRAELLSGRGSQFDSNMADAMLSVLKDLAHKRAHCLEIAREAASLIDADKHKRLQTREDEETDDYREIQGILRRLLDAHEGVRYVTTLTRRASKFVFVVDPEEIERLKSHTGDELLVPGEEMLEAYTGEHGPESVVLNADEYGVWVSGFAPLIDSAGEIVGVVCVDSPPRSLPPDSEENKKPFSLASLLGETGRRIAHAEFEAITDGLTGLYNHRYLHECLDEEISRSTLAGTEFALLFIDIDHFKAFNDRWGHSVGDAALRAVAQIIQGEVRRADVIGRYGGEEFVAILAETGSETAVAVAKRIRQRIARSMIVAGTSPLTVSVGLAVFPSDAGSKAELLERGDQAMYEAKTLGRDCIHAYSAPFPAGQPGQASEAHR